MSRRLNSETVLFYGAQESIPAAYVAHSGPVQQLRSDSVRSPHKLF
jgi:hypothetical protein